MKNTMTATAADLANLAQRVEREPITDALGWAVVDAIMDRRQVDTLPTSSVDAAIRLLPDGSQWLIDSGRDDDLEPAYVSVICGGIGRHRRLAQARARTPAAALTAAALRARAAMMEKEL